MRGPFPLSALSAKRFLMVQMEFLFCYTTSCLHQMHSSSHFGFTKQRSITCGYTLSKLSSPDCKMWYKKEFRKTEAINVMRCLVSMDTHAHYSAVIIFHHSNRVPPPPPPPTNFALCVYHQAVTLCRYIQGKKLNNPSKSSTS